jgi:cytochrome P450
MAPANLKTDKRLREHMEEFERLWKRFQGTVNVDSRTEAEIVLKYMRDMTGEMLLAVAGVTQEERVQTHVAKDRDPECCSSRCVKYGDPCVKAPNPCATRCIGDCRGGDGPCPNNR